MSLGNRVSGKVFECISGGGCGITKEIKTTARPGPGR